MKLEELKKLAGLTDEQLNKAFDGAFDEVVNFDHKPTPEEIINIRFQAIADAQLAAVLPVINDEVEKAKKEGLTQDEKILLTFFNSHAIHNIDLLRAWLNISYLVDLLTGAEKFLHDFQETMIGAGKAKKEGVLHATDMLHTVEKQIAELSMWTTLARSKIGGQALQAK